MDRAPTISTARLTLRHPNLEDFKVMVPYFASDWARYMDGPYTETSVWKMLGSEMATWQLLGHGTWSVDLTDTGQFIGQVGITKPPRYPDTEIGWCIWPDFESKGYVREAAQAALDWAWTSHGFDTLVSYIDPENARSIALAERLGATNDTNAARPDGETADECLVYRHRRAA